MGREAGGNNQGVKRFGTRWEVRFIRKQNPGEIEKILQEVLRVMRWEPLWKWEGTRSKIYEKQELHIPPFTIIHQIICLFRLLLVLSNCPGVFCFEFYVAISCWVNFFSFTFIAVVSSQSYLVYWSVDRAQQTTDPVHLRDDIKPWRHCLKNTLSII